MNASHWSCDVTLVNPRLATESVRTGSVSSSYSADASDFVRAPHQALILRDVGALHDRHGRGSCFEHACDGKQCGTGHLEELIDRDPRFLDRLGRALGPGALGERLVLDRDAFFEPLIRFTQGGNLRFQLGAATHALLPPRAPPTRRNGLDTSFSQTDDATHARVRAAPQHIVNPPSTEIVWPVT